MSEIIFQYGRYMMGPKNENITTRPEIQIMKATGIQMEQTKQKGLRLKVDVLEQLMEHLDEVQKVNFTGHIKINYSQGAIGRIEKFEEISKILKRASCL